MANFIDAMETSAISMAGSRQVKALAMDEESRFAGSVIGSLGWLSIRPRADVSMDCSWLVQQEIPAI
eukprot:8314643-Pyramimonas_sp.AAC.1